MAGNRRQPKRGSASESRYSLMEFMREFPDDDACLNYLWTTRYAPDGSHARCPRCEVKRAFRRYQTGQQRQSWTCTACGLHLHPTAGTIFHKSSTALHLWFYAIYLITSTRCGISAKQLEREIGVGYKTAWRMFNLIRNSLMAETPAPLSGKVEMDETYFSKSRRLGMPVRSGLATDERTVFAMVERKGNVVARHVGGPTTLQVEPHIKEFVLPASTIFTDQSTIYGSLPKRGYQHRRINHSERIYVAGDVHTQTVEGFFSLLKSGIRGVYHSVSAKWLQSYLDEYAWRYNHREHTERGTGERRMPIGEAKFRLLLTRAAAVVERA
jgi:transposase-like protein